MKTRPILYLLLLTFLCLQALPQEYDSLVVENAQWKVIWDDDFTPWVDGMTGWLLRGDTNINGIQYKKLYRRSFEEPNSNVIVSQSLFGCLREDVENRKVYAYDLIPGWEGCDTLNDEYLLFDFSLAIGDPTKMCILTENIGDPVLTNIYQEEVFGKTRNIYDFGMESSDFIEGIGHFQGLMESPIYLVSRLVFTELIDYCRGTDEECGVFYVNVDERFCKKSISIYPNPASDFVKISFGNKGADMVDMTISINDVYGRCVRKMDFFKEDFSLNVSDLQTGIYFVNILERNNIITSKKLFIAN